jgi:hypothetical protein
VIDRFRIVGAMSNGVSFVCAHCDKFWWSVDRGFTECKAAVEGKFCAGPLQEHAFPEYSGPLGDNLSLYCFVCGDDSTKAAVAKKGTSKGKCVGVCAKHFDMLQDTGIQDERPRFLEPDKKIAVRSG